MAFRVSEQEFLGSGIALIVVATLFVLARLVGGYKQARKITISDYIAVSAIVFLVGTFVIFNLTTDALSDPHTSLFRLGQIGVASTLISGASTWTAKSPILLLYIQLFGIKRWVKIICYAVLLITFLFLLSLNSYVAATCNPTGETDLIAVIMKCTSVTSLGGLITGVFGVVTDVIILAVPLPIVLKLNLPLGKRLGITAVFLTGIFGLAASSTSLYFRWASSSGLNVDYRAATTWTIIELSIAIIVGCVPAAYAACVVYAVNNAFFSKISLLLENLSNRSKTSQELSRSGASVGHSNSHGPSDEYTHPYGTLDDSGRVTTNGSRLTKSDEVDRFPLQDMRKGSNA